MSSPTRRTGPAGGPLDRSLEEATSGTVPHQLVLPGAPPVVARRDDHATSIEAGGRARGDAGRVRALVLAAHRRRPGAGLTDDELACELPDEHPGTLAKRRKDLVDEGLVEATNWRRETRRGVSAIVWRLTATERP